MARQLSSVAGLLIAAMVSACASTATPPPARSELQAPWRAGNADMFQTGAAEEGRRKAANGLLPVTILPP